MSTRPPERVNEATAANEHYASVLYGLELTMLEDCNQGRGTSGIREAAEHLRAAQHALERERGRMVHDHLRYNDPAVAATVQTFRDLVRPGAIDERVREWHPGGMGVS